jgi:PIN domain nuclease of toxin-antitoxin system
MILLDTHVWIWLAADKQKLSRKAARRIAGASRLGLCTISLWEAAMLLQHGRLRVDRDLEEWLEQAAALPNLELFPISPAIATSVHSLGKDFHGDPADRIIAATAITHRATVITKDERLQSCERLTCVW